MRKWSVTVNSVNNDKPQKSSTPFHTFSSNPLSAFQTKVQVSNAHLVVIMKRCNLTGSNKTKQNIVKCKIENSIIWAFSVHIATIRVCSLFSLFFFDLLALVHRLYSLCVVSIESCAVDLVRFRCPFFNRPYANYHVAAGKCTRLTIQCYFIAFIH